MHRLSFSRQTRCLLLIFLCFLWTSAGYLSWLYRLLDMLDGVRVELAAEVAGYLLQALGLLIFALAARQKPAFPGRLPFMLFTLADLACTALAVLAAGTAPLLIFGGCMNLLHGLLAGFYLHRLSAAVEWDRRGRTFGVGYGLASLAAWLLSLFGNGNLLRSWAALPVYTALAALCVWLLWTEPQSAKADAPSPSAHSRSLLWLAAVSVVLLSLVKGLGFSFPSADLRKGIDLELSRVFYAIGLIVAGLLSDRERKFGAIACVASLGVPFLLILLSDQLGPSIVFWILSYLLSGFFSVYRVLLFCDLAQKEAGTHWRSGLGLLFGRIGDALGALGCVLLAAHTALLVGLAAALFMTAVVCAFLLYQRLYLPVPLPIRSERERFESFCAACDLSSREREVLHLILDGLSTQEIAAQLFVTESTVKFHVHNLLKKTACSNRIELVSRYQAE
ncbi:MAG: helix-turn-helix transcriptional regulator [Oscillospiraceae bacterium]|nr:helix-turn-helix transcriptional regulator [Oscillospiraceae bacterium]